MKLRRVWRWSVRILGVLLLAGVLMLVVAYLRSDNACSEAGTFAPADPMQAIVQCEFGSPAVLRVASIEKPRPAADQVLVRVRAAAVNPLDWHYLRGTPYVGRLAMGLRKPKSIRLGVDFAGVVEAVGPEVTQFAPGDEVFGGRTGALAEYVTVGASKALAPKPAHLSFEQAAAVPIAAITALQGLRDGGQLQPGQRVLINGASGGVGTFAVQIAKSLGGHVTGVCSTRNVELVRSLGADRVIDYKREDFTRGGERYDLILDNVGNHSLSKLRRVLEPTGRLVLIGGSSGRWLSPLPRILNARVMSWFVSQDLRFLLAHLNADDLRALSDLMSAGKVTPVIDRTYPGLAQAAEAIRYLEEGHARGKVVVTVD